MKNKKTIFIGIGTFDDVKKDVIHAVKRLEAGLPAEEPRHKIYFTEPAHLSKALSPKRMKLLKFLKKHGPLSRRQIAIKIKRAYANIHQDIKELISIDLAKINREKKIFVPWDEIDIAVSLAT